MIRVIHGMIVPTLRVGMPRVTLRVTLDAERPDCRYHAERGNDHEGDGRTHEGD
jgi:hypothetical protein